MTVNIFIAEKFETLPIHIIKNILIMLYTIYILFINKYDKTTDIKIAEQKTDKNKKIGEIDVKYVDAVVRAKNINNFINKLSKKLMTCGL